MISWFKKHFIPHEGNNHQPHILRDYSIRNITIMVLFFEIFTFLLPTLTHINQTGGMAAVLPAILSNLTNEERQEQKLKTLTINPILNKAAQMKAEDMAKNGYFAHTSPEGKTPWYWIDQVGYKYQYAGENLAINFSDSKDVTNAWMNSPTHKANIVKDKYTEVGTGIANGIYEGKKTIFVAQIYTNPLPENMKNAVLINKEIQNKKLEVNNEVKNVLGTETILESDKTKINDIYINSTSEIETNISKPNLIQRFIASPRNTTSTILFIIFGIIVFALFLNILIKIEYSHPKLITNGMIILAMIGIILIANNYISHKSITITQNIDYSFENTHIN